MSNEMSHWESMFDHAMDILDRLDQTLENDQLNEWTFGGGTALMQQIKHRLSRDVDLFTPDLQILGHVRSIVSDHYVDPGIAKYDGDGAFYVKVIFEDRGEVDFIAAVNILEPYAIPKNIRGREIQLETVSEIIAKKIYYRGDSIIPRDVFDIAAAIHAGYREKIMTALATIPDNKLCVFAKSLATVRNRPKFAEILAQTAVMPGFETVRESALEIVNDLLGDYLSG